MKSLKVFYMGERLRDIYPHATRWQVIKFRIRTFFRRVLQVLSVATAGGLVIYLSFLAGQVSTPEKIMAITRLEQREFPVMDRIAVCESSGSHFSKTTGQVLAVGNTNKSVDVGKYGINLQTWGSKATELGYDIFTEEGNKKMAEWIYANHGTEPWYASKSCWNK